MLTEVAQYIMVILFILILLWAGFILQHVLIGSNDILEVTIYSTAFGLAFLAIVCVVLDFIWDISLISVGCSVILLSGLLFFRKPQKVTFSLKKVTFPNKWELFILLLIFCYGFLLRSNTLFDPLPKGQDAWAHMTFIQYIHCNHALPEFIPWIEPPRLVNLVTYPPGSHCISALLSQPFPDVSFTLTKIFFLSMGTGSVLSSYVVFKPLLGKKGGLLSIFFVAVFVPHMIMTTEITAEAVSIFIFPLIPYLFYKKKMVASGILLGGVIIIHHFTAFAAGISLLALAIIFFIRMRDTKYVFSFFGAALIGLALSAPWWSQQPFYLGIFYPSSSSAASQVLFNPYTEMVSPLFIVLSMIGVFIFLKNRDQEYYLFLITWSVALFISSQPTPIRFHPHRFLAFFIFPCSALASMGLLSIQRRLNKTLFVFLLLLIFSTGYPPHFWPSVGEDNMVATEWVQDSTLDSVVYVYGRHYIFVYSLSHRKMYEIVDFDDPFTYRVSPTYFYDDAAWVPHDITQFGQFDKLYSCSGVVIFRIE